MKCPIFDNEQILQTKFDPKKSVLIPIYDTACLKTTLHISYYNCLPKKLAKMRVLPTKISQKPLNSFAQIFPDKYFSTLDDNHRYVDGNYNCDYDDVLGRTD